MVKPISPDDVKRVIPDFVIEAVNELISERINVQRCCTIMQKDIRDRIMTKTDQDFVLAWLDFESHFIDAGWDVVYDKPGYCESYEAFFKFSPRGQGKF